MISLFLRCMLYRATVFCLHWLDNLLNLFILGKLLHWIMSVSVDITVVIWWVFLTVLSDCSLQCMPLFSPLFCVFIYIIVIIHSCMLVMKQTRIIFLFFRLCSFSVVLIIQEVGSLFWEVILLGHYGKKNPYGHVSNLNGYQDRDILIYKHKDIVNGNK